MKHKRFIDGEPIDGTEIFPRNGYVGHACFSELVWEYWHFGIEASIREIQRYFGGNSASIDDYKEPLTHPFYICSN